jgi:prepilin-type processing-associated H-X9-DG protein
MQEPVKLLFKLVGLASLLAASSLFSLHLYSDLHSTNAAIASLRRQLSDAAAVKAENETLQQILRLSEDLDDLRKDNAELLRARREIVRLQTALEKRKRDSAHSLEEQLSQLQTENLQLRHDNQQLEQTPKTVSAREAVDLNELAEIGQILGLYASMNSNNLPHDLTELKSYAATDVFSTFETNRFEFVYQGNLTDISDPAKTPLMRSKFEDDQNQRPYLFADGHVATKKE